MDKGNFEEFKRSLKQRKNILFVTSAAPSQAPFSTSEKRPPAGIGFLISVLRNAGHNVFFIDNYLEPSDFIETDYLQQNDIDFVGIYANTICYRDTMRMFKKLQRLRSEGKWSGKIMVGGPHATVAVNTIPDYVDYVVQGEAEQAVIDIVEEKIHDRIICYQRLENLDKLPSPAWDYFVGKPYDWSMRFIEKGPVFTMNTSRGCPFKCNFCSVCSIWGKQYTYFSAERVVSDIEYLMKEYGAKGIYFREDNFTLNRKRLEKFCNLIIEKQIKIQWVCESRVSNLDIEITRLMARAGLKGFYFGVESGSQRLLDMMEKGITVDQIRNAFKLCKEANVKAAASLITGVPGETIEDIKATSYLLKEIEPDVVWVNVFVGIPDSKLYQYCLNNKICEYIDDRGLLYLPGHDDRVKQYYGDGLNAAIPFEQSCKDMTNLPKISVLMAVHNAEQYIEEAMESIYNQSYQDFEVIIVDDASTDKTPEKLLEIKDARTSIYRNRENIGLTKSLNVGLKLCRGRFVARMDADDISYPKRFEKQIKFFEENPRTDVLGCWCHRITIKGRIIGSYDGRPTETLSLEQGLLEGNSIAHGTAMVRRNKLIEVGGYNEKFKYAQDHDLWLRLSEVAELRNLPEYLYGLRTWTGNITNKNTDQQYRFSQQAVKEAKVRRKEKTLTKSAITKQAFSSEIKEIPLVSIIMPVYNGQQHLKQAIESVLSQDYSNLEVIIINDGSTDKSKEIILSYKDDRIKYFEQENKGLAAAHNKGIKESKGEFVIKVDHDDYITADFVSKHIEEFRNHPEADLVYCDDIFVEDEVRSSRVHKKREYTDRKLLIRDLFRCGFPLIPFRTCIRRSVFDKIGFFDESLRIGEDYDMMRRFVKAGLNAHHLPQALYYRRLGPESLSRNYSIEKAYSQFGIIRKFPETFSHDELFPDVSWDKIPFQNRDLMVKSLITMAYIQHGQFYLESDLPDYAGVALENADMQLNECLSIVPENLELQKLKEKCQRLQKLLTGNKLVGNNL